MMYALSSLVLILSCLSLSGAQAEASDVIVLTTKNFEHLTQVSTGATTGDWLVEFYAPWCGHCKKLTPTYEKVATALKGQVNVAKVDVTENKELGERFGIRGFPTIKFFRKGQVYDYKGSRDEASFVAFATSGYASHESTSVPNSPGPLDNVKSHFTLILKDFISLLATKKNVLLLTFGVGLSFGIFLGYCCCCCCSRSSSVKTKKD